MALAEPGIFFVGGRGNKAGDANAGGGATKAAWEGDLNEDLANVMGTNGEPLSDPDAWGGTGDACSVVEGNDGNVRIVVEGSGYFTNCKVGLVAHCVFEGVYDSGRYQVVAVDTTNGDWIDIYETYTNNTVCDVKVGGAFDTLQNASDNVDASSFDMEIRTNKDETSLAATIDIDVGGGSAVSRTWKRIVGADANGAELSDGNYIQYVQNASRHVINITANYVELAHLYPKDSQLHKGFTDGTTAILRDCKSTGCSIAVQGFTRGYILGGYFSSINPAFLSDGVVATTAIGAEFYVSSADQPVINAYRYGGMGGLTLVGCIIRKNGAGRGIQCAGSGACFNIINCVVYNAEDCIYIDSEDAIVRQYNNIFMVAAGASDKAINLVKGNLQYSDYSCLWSVDDKTPSASNRWGYSDTPPNCIEQDPKFTDPANGDFSLQSDSPCIDTGKPTLEGGYSTMGCWDDEHAGGGGGRRPRIRWHNV